MAYFESFYDFLSDNSIPAYNVKFSSSGKSITFLEFSVVDELVKHSYALPVSKGGLVIGKFHTEGGIHMLSRFENGFQYIGEMEGYEYLVNPLSTKEHKNFLHNINDSVNHVKESEPYRFNVPRQIKTINLDRLKFDIIIIPEGEQFIVNRTATEKYLNQIDGLNDRRSFKKILRLFGL